MCQGILSLCCPLTTSFQFLFFTEISGSPGKRKGSDKACLDCDLRVRQVHTLETGRVLSFRLIVAHSCIMVGQKHSDVVAPKTGLHQPSTKGDILGQVDPPKVSNTVVTEIGGTELLVVSPNNVNDPEKGAEGYSKDEPQ